MTFQLKIKEDSGHPEGGGNPDVPAEPVQGQNVAQEDIKDMLNNLGITIRDAVQGAATTPAPKEPQPVHHQLGLSDSQAASIKEALGDGVYDSLFGSLGGIIQKSEQNDLLIADHLNNIAGDIQKKFEEQAQAIKSINVNPVNELQMRQLYGFDKYFNENNHDDLVDCLSELSERSGGVLDAISDFNEAEQNNNYDKLLKYKASFEGFLQNKYKDHESVIGSNGNSIKADVKTANEQDKEIDALLAKQELLMKQKKFAEATEIGDQINALLD